MPLESSSSQKSTSTQAPHSTNQSATPSRPSMRPPTSSPSAHLTLIVASTRNLGIGKNNTLPWPPIKPDLRFFARVTKRVPPPPRPSSTSSSNKVNSANDDSGATSSAQKPHRATLNAVIMGRKTWDSLPPQARPLKGRVNVVLSSFSSTRGTPNPNATTTTATTDETLWYSSLEEAVRLLSRRMIYHQPDAGKQTGQEESETEKQGQHPSLPEVEHGRGDDTAAIVTDDTPRIGRIFVIGGAQIYKLALQAGLVERILWTRVRNLNFNPKKGQDEDEDQEVDRDEYDCDTFFPPGILPSASPDAKTDQQEVGGEGQDHRWVRRSTKELESWSGESGIGGVKTEGEVEFEISMWEREST